jgi:hypothetical protein
LNAAPFSGVDARAALNRLDVVFPFQIEGGPQAARFLGTHLFQT